VGSEAPYQPGQLSPDGMWRWDGARWIPSGQQGRQPLRPRGSRTWIWWLAGGCALLLLIGAGGAIWGALSLVNAVQHGALNCLPSDFPSYPGATITREYTYFGGGVAPGDSKECQMTLESDDDSATVSDFYASRLDSGDWTVTANDSANGQIRFHRVSRPLTMGILDLLARGQHTEIQLKLDS